MSLRAARLGCIILAAVAGLAGCASTPPEQDPVQIKLNDLDTRLARIERVVSNQSLLELANQLEALQGQVRSLRNDVDQLSNNLESGRKQQRDLYADLNQRVKSLEGREGAMSPAGSASAAPQPGASPAADGPDQASYQAAFALLKDSQYDQAVGAFRRFLAAFPDSPLAENAQYWLGEAYYVNKAFPDALGAFQRVVERYPQSRKLPDALLKIGYCRYEMKQWDEAKQTLSQVAANYSDTPAGHLAQQRLERMAAEKH